MELREEMCFTRRGKRLSTTANEYLKPKAPKSEAKPQPVVKLPLELQNMTILHLRDYGKRLRAEVAELRKMLDEKVQIEESLKREFEYVKSEKRNERAKGKQIN